MAHVFGGPFGEIVQHQVQNHVSNVSGAVFNTPLVNQYDPVLL